ncbi:MAG: polyphenol oxidase family protein [Verrucomicrobiales bacterium]|nr:polyphenol oxidase family protein [Verrucomicrobiales bacterium]
MWVETFRALSEIEGLAHAFVQRVPGIDVVTGKEQAIERLRFDHDLILVGLGMDRSCLWTAEQVHGADLAWCSGVDEQCDQGAVDGLLTAEREVNLGIYVADCCAVYVVDAEHQAIALLHSGKCGTELGIVPRAIDEMCEQYGSDRKKIVVQLSPCIRPPWYEVDFAATIVEQCRSAGLLEGNIHGSEACTATQVDRYYSYRREQGKTGRMLAVMGWREEF